MNGAKTYFWALMGNTLAIVILVVISVILRTVGATLADVSPINTLVLGLLGIESAIGAAFVVKLHMDKNNKNDQSS